MYRFDEQSNYVFVGDYSGQISVLKINNQTFNLITTLKGHSGKFNIDVILNLCLKNKKTKLFFYLDSR